MSVQGQLMSGEAQLTAVGSQLMSIVVFWVQRHSRLAHQKKTTKTPKPKSGIAHFIAGIQRHLCYHFGIRTCVFGAHNRTTPKTPNSGIAHFKHLHQVSKDTFVGIFGAEVCARRTQTETHLQEDK